MFQNSKITKHGEGGAGFGGGGGATDETTFGLVFCWGYTRGVYIYIWIFLWYIILNLRRNN